MPNALIEETSPYLLQHAHNPVEWQPWGEAAFQRARAEDRPVFLSIGYSTCHWCHVMEHESFENDAIAAVMNRHFINVKVDREERPDIDATYMAFVQATTGQGGWPMSVWLTPEGEPMAGGTYFPPEDRHGRPGFPTVCEQIGQLWRKDQAKLRASAADIMRHLRQQASETATVRGLPDPTVFGDFLDRCEAVSDPEWGGFGGPPKFPRPVVLRCLMQLADRFGRTSEEGKMAWQMAQRTLLGMAAGGMRDHLGGGFHRYSVDRFWHIPHFEKMLYDQAQLLMAYLDAWQISGEAGFREVAESVCEYLLGGLRDGGGGFHAAEDADSLPAADAAQTREGAFWTWEAAEISSILEPEEAALFAAAYGVEANGNARPGSDPHGELEGRNTLFRAMQDDALAALFESTPEAVRQRLRAVRERLLRARAKRPSPHRDDKIVTAWNGLAIGALARAARVLERPDLLEAARRAAQFLRRELWIGETLFRSFRGHRGTVPAFPADYVFLIAGLIELHGLRPDEGWLGWARDLQRVCDASFWDARQAGYVMRSSLHGETLLVIREDYDGAKPASNHLAAENLLKLASLLEAPEFAKRAEALLRSGARLLETRPFAAPVLLAALDLHERGIMKIQVPAGLSETGRERLHASYLPRAIFDVSPTDELLLCGDMGCRRVDPADLTNGKLMEAR